MSSSTAKPWVPYIGEYEKTFYDVRLHSHEEMLECWPNAGTFHAADRLIQGHEVAYTRVRDETIWKI